MQLAAGRKRRGRIWLWAPSPNPLRNVKAGCGIDLHVGIRSNALECGNLLPLFPPSKLAGWNSKGAMKKDWNGG
jgi:hypothetical protein